DRRAGSAPRPHRPQRRDAVAGREPEGGTLPAARQARFRPAASDPRPDNQPDGHRPDDPRPDDHRPLSYRRSGGPVAWRITLAMYVPPTFSETEPEKLLELCARYPLATVITPTAAELWISHVPLLARRREGR